MVAESKVSARSAVVSPAWDVIVIGSGMSGLSSAVILAKEGKRVLVLEQHYRPGGYLHRFFRKGGVSFDTGFHYFGAVQREQVLGVYLDYLGVREALDFVPLDADGYDRIAYPGLSFAIPAGHERYRERLIDTFPADERVIDRYFSDLAEICAGFGLYQLRAEQAPGHADRWMSVSVSDYFDQLGASPELRAVLLGQNPLYGVAPRRTPLALHALVTDSFMQGAYALRGGGDALARAMVRRIESLGGRVKTRQRVSSIEVDDDRQVRAVTTDGGERFEAPVIISCAHPKATLRMLPDGVLRPGYRRRVLGMEDGPSTLSLFITTTADLSAHGGHNVYRYTSTDLDALYDDREQFAFVTVPSAREATTRDGRHQVIALGLLPWSKVAPWAQSRTGERGASYEAFKAEQAEALLPLVYESLPALRGTIESMEVATPLTNRDYTGNEAGAAYGILRSVEQAGRYGVRSRTRARGLYLTGQSVLMPGVCGVTISAFHTCSMLLGAEYLMEKVHAHRP